MDQSLDALHASLGLPGYEKPTGEIPSAGGSTGGPSAVSSAPQEAARVDLENLQRGLESRISDIEETIAKLQDQLAGVIMPGDLDALRGKLEAKINDLVVGSAPDADTLLITALAAVQTENEELKSVLATLTEIVTSLTARLDKSEAEQAKLQEQIRQLTSEIDRAHEECGQTRHDVETAINKFSMVQTDLEDRLENMASKVRYLWINDSDWLDLAIGIANQFGIEVEEVDKRRLATVPREQRSVERARQYWTKKQLLQIFANEDVNNRLLTALSWKVARRQMNLERAIAEVRATLEPAPPEPAPDTAPDIPPEEPPADVATQRNQFRAFLRKMTRKEVIAWAKANGYPQVPTGRGVSKETIIGWLVEKRFPTS